MTDKMMSLRTLLEKRLPAPSVVARQNRPSRAANRRRSNRPLEGDWPYLWLDATYVKTGENGRIVSVAAMRNSPAGADAPLARLRRAS